MLHLPGFYYVKKPKRFVILCSDKSSERNLSCFFDMREPRKMEHLQKEEPFSSDPYFSRQARFLPSHAHWPLQFWAPILSYERSKPSFLLLLAPQNILTFRRPWRIVKRSCPWISNKVPKARGFKINGRCRDNFVTAFWLAKFPLFDCENCPYQFPSFFQTRK